MSLDLCKKAFDKEITAPDINILPVPDFVSISRHFVLVPRNSCRSSVYSVLLKFENLPVFVTGRKRTMSVTHEIVPDSDQDQLLFHALMFQKRLRHSIN